MVHMVQMQRYLGTTNGKVKFMLSGIIGEVDQKEVQVVDVSKAESVSYYKVVSGRLYHYIVGNVTHSGYDSCLDNGRHQIILVLIQIIIAMMDIIFIHIIIS